MCIRERMGAALFLAGVTIIVGVFLAVCTVGLAGHAAAAAPADQNTGEQVHRILVGRSPGIQSLDVYKRQVVSILKLLILVLG